MAENDGEKQLSHLNMPRMVSGRPYCSAEGLAHLI